jgi:hypothetical protein
VKALPAAILMASLSSSVWAETALKTRIPINGIEPVLEKLIKAGGETDYDVRFNSCFPIDGGAECNYSVDRFASLNARGATEDGAPTQVYILLDDRAQIADFLVLADLLMQAYDPSMKQERRALTLQKTIDGYNATGVHGKARGKAVMFEYIGEMFVLQAP